MSKEIQEGAIVLMMKNEDDSFSPLMINKDHARILEYFISGLSQKEPLSKLKDKYRKP